MAGCDAIDTDEVRYASHARRAEPSTGSRHDLVTGLVTRASDSLRTAPRTPQRPGENACERAPLSSSEAPAFQNVLDLSRRDRGDAETFCHAVA